MVRDITKAIVGDAVGITFNSYNFIGHHSSPQDLSAKDLSACFSRMQHPPPHHLSYQMEPVNWFAFLPFSSMPSMRKSSEKELALEHKYALRPLFQPPPLVTMLEVLLRNIAVLINCVPTPILQFGT